MKTLVTCFRGGSRGRVQGVRTPLPPPPAMTCGFLIQLVFCKKKNYVVEVEQETSAPPPKKNAGSAPVFELLGWKNLARQHEIEKATMVYKSYHDWL